MYPRGKIQQFNLQVGDAKSISVPDSLDVDVFLVVMAIPNQSLFIDVLVFMMCAMCLYLVLGVVNTPIQPEIKLRKKHGEELPVLGLPGLSP